MVYTEEKEPIEIPDRLPLLPVRDIVIFNHMFLPLYVGRESSIHAVDEALGNDRLIFLATQKDPKTDEPTEDDLYDIGIVGQIIQLLKLPDGTVKVLVEGKHRGRILSFIDRSECVFARIEPLADQPVESPEVEALLRSACEAFENYVNLSKKIPTWAAK